MFKTQKNNQGQSIIEFLMFLPLIIILFLTAITIASSINGSINQQKATRGYFYFLAKGNPKYPEKSDLEAFMSGGIEIVGMNLIGWRDYSIGPKAVAACYSLSNLVSTEASDTCEDTGDISGDEPKSKFIRPYTAFGVCTSYVFKINARDDYTDMSELFWTSGNCVMR